MSVVCEDVVPRKEEGEGEEDGDLSPWETAESDKSRKVFAEKAGIGKKEN